MSTTVVVIVALILVNGVFAAMEMAFVTSRRHRLKLRVELGDKRAKEVLRAKEKPGHYFATTQVGITLVTSLASVLGGVALEPVLAGWLRRIPLLAPYAEQLALLLIVVGISYLTLVLGELVPKQLALRNPERVAAMLFKPVKLLSQIASWPIKFLSFSSELVLGIFAPGAARTPSTSSEEIELLVQQGTAEGIFQISEGAFVSGVFEYGDRKAVDVMKARTEIVALEADLQPPEALDLAAKSGLSRFPIYEDDLDNIVGYIHIKDLIWAEQSTILRDIARQILFIPETAKLPDIYKRLTQQRAHIAVVLDEHGGTAGLLTLEDLLEVIVGEIDDEYHLSQGDVHKLGEQAWLVAGSTPVSELGELVGVELEPTQAYNTTAGLVMAGLGHIPKVGEALNQHGLTFTVRQMDKLRIDRLLVQKK
jgi:putative hemolysin